MKIPQLNRAGVECGGQPKKHVFKAPTVEPTHERWSVCCPPCHHVDLSRRRWTINHHAGGIPCASLRSATTTPKMLWIEKETVHATHPNPRGVNKGLIYTELAHGLHNSASPPRMHSQGQLRFISAPRWAHPKLHKPSSQFSPWSPWWLPSSSKSSKRFWRGTQQVSQTPSILHQETYPVYITRFGSWGAQHLIQNTAAHRRFAANSWAIL